MCFFSSRRRHTRYWRDWSSDVCSSDLRPLEGTWPYLWIDATYVKVREGGRIVSMATIVAVGVNTDGRREVLGVAAGASEAEPFWKAFLRSLADRGLRGVKRSEERRVGKECRSRGS